jgi:hypothetical protein
MAQPAPWNETVSSCVVYSKCIPLSARTGNAKGTGKPPAAIPAAGAQLDGASELRDYNRRGRKQMSKNVRRVSLVYILAAASVCITGSLAYAENLNLLCYENTAPNGKKNYNVFWIDFENGIVTVGSAAGGPNDADEPAVNAVSRTVPVAVSPEAFTFGSQGGPEKIDRKTGFYSQANGKQERCWKVSMPIPAR